jgi:hypothetical protein
MVNENGGKMMGTTLEELDAAVVACRLRGQSAIAAAHKVMLHQDGELTTKEQAAMAVFEHHKMVASLKGGRIEECAEDRLP